MTWKHLKYHYPGEILLISEEYAENVQVEDESNYIINFFGETSKVLTDEEIEKLGLFER